MALDGSRGDGRVKPPLVGSLAREASPFTLGGIGRPIPYEKIFPQIAVLKGYYQRIRWSGRPHEQIRGAGKNAISPDKKIKDKDPLQSSIRFTVEVCSPKGKLRLLSPT